MSFITHYTFEVSLPEGWEENKEESLQYFISETNRKSNFIDNIIESNIIQLDSLTLTFDVAVSMKEDNSGITGSDESLGTDFWVKVAQGAEY